MNQKLLKAISKRVTDATTANCLRAISRQLSDLAESLEPDAGLTETQIRIMETIGRDSILVEKLPDDQTALDNLVTGGKLIKIVDRGKVKYTWK